MEKAGKSKSRIFSFIFLNQQPYSPGREKFKAGKGFSGPIISIIPAEARRKTRNGSFDAQQEPTSPKVSCIGQIKHKKKICKAKCVATPPPAKVVKDSTSSGNKKQERQGKKKQGASAIGKLFHKGKKHRPREEEEEEVENVEVIRAPGLGQMRKFSSGREAFRDFDYRAADRGGAAAALNRARGYYSDHGDHSDDDDDDEDDYEDDFQVPYSGPLVAFSAPLAVGGSAGGRAQEPRKEINIWKRRTMAPPQPLELISNKNKRF